MALSNGYPDGSPNLSPVGASQPSGAPYWRSPHPYQGYASPVQGYVPPAGSPYPPNPYVPFPLNASFAPPSPPKRNKALVAIVVVLAIILCGSLAALLFMWHPWRAATPPLSNGISEEYKPQIVLTLKEEEKKQLSQPSGQPYSVLIDADYVLVVAPISEKEYHYAVVQRADGHVAKTAAPVKLPSSADSRKESGSKGILPACRDSERYVLDEAELVCVPISTVQTYEHGDVHGEIAYSDSEIVLVAAPTVNAARSVIAMNSDDEVLWVRHLDEPRAVSADKQGLIVTEMGDEGVMLGSYIPAVSKLPQEQALPSVAHDAIKDFDFEEALWHLPQPGITPTMLSEKGDAACLDSAECEERQILAQDFSYPYQFHEGKYYLSDAEAEAAIAKRNDEGIYDPESFFGNLDPQQYPIMEIISADGGSPVEYGDLDGDGYTDAVVTMRYELGLYGVNSGSLIPLAWRMNPVTGMPEQISPALLATNRCGEVYDYTEFGVPEDNFLTVHYLDFDQNNFCCACERTAPKEFVLEFDPQSRTFQRH